MAAHTAAEAGLTITRITPPLVRGFRWELFITPTRASIEEAEWPADLAPVGRRPPPVPTRPAHTIGLDDAASSEELAERQN